MTNSERHPSRLCAAFALAGLLIGGAACTREEVNRGAEKVEDGAERVGHEIKEGVHEIREELPPASEVKEDIKDGAQKAGHAVKRLGENVAREAKATRDLVRDRSRETADSNER